MKMDKAGLRQIHLTLGTLASALGSHTEDAIKVGIVDLTEIDTAHQDINNAQDALAKFIKRIEQHEAAPRE